MTSRLEQEWGKTAVTLSASSIEIRRLTFNPSKGLSIKLVHRHNVSDGSSGMLFEDLVLGLGTYEHSIINDLKEFQGALEAVLGVPLTMPADYKPEVNFFRSCYIDKYVDFISSTKFSEQDIYQAVEKAAKQLGWKLRSS